MRHQKWIVHILRKPEASKPLSTFAQRPSISRLPQKHASSRPLVSGSTSITQDNHHIRASIQIPGIEHAEITLTGQAFEQALLWKLKWTSLARLLSLITWGYREEAIGIFGREVMQPRGLVRLGMDTLEYSTGEIGKVFDILADEANYPIMVHCTQGKTGRG